jgi:hypothetical protein
MDEDEKQEGATMMEIHPASILSQIKSLEAQLGALKAQVERLSAQEPTPTHTFADLYGRYREFGDMSAEDIDAVLYRLPDDPEEPT